MQNTNQKANIQSSKMPASAGQKSQRPKGTGRQKQNAIWSRTIDGTTISIVPRHAGRVAVRIGHREGQYYRALCCTILPSRLLAMSLDDPIGTIILDGVDVMSPELCEAKEYRDDGHGYSKHLVVMRVDAATTAWSVTCTLCARGDDGHICSAGDYNHTISMQVGNETVEAMLQSVERWSVAQQSASAREAVDVTASPAEKELDIHVDN